MTSVAILTSFLFASASDSRLLIHTSVRFLIEQGANIHIGDNNNSNPLHIASLNGYLSIHTRCTASEIRMWRKRVVRFSWTLTLTSCVWPKTAPATRTCAPSVAQLSISQICNSSTAHKPNSFEISSGAFGNTAKEKSMCSASGPRTVDRAMCNDGTC